MFRDMKRACEEHSEDCVVAGLSTRPRGRPSKSCCQRQRHLWLVNKKSATMRRRTVGPFYKGCRGGEACSCPGRRHKSLDQIFGHPALTSPEHQHLNTVHPQGPQDMSSGPSSPQSPDQSTQPLNPHLSCTTDRPRRLSTPGETVSSSSDKIQSSSNKTSLLARALSLPESAADQGDPGLEGDGRRSTRAEAPWARPQYAPQEDVSRTKASPGPYPRGPDPCVLHPHAQHERLVAPPDAAHMHSRWGAPCWREVEAARASGLDRWSVDDVTAFISDIPGCAEYAQLFRDQSIDGEALLQLSEDHLLNILGVRLGHVFRILRARDFVTSFTPVSS